jgi:hypothetical protein
LPGLRLNAATANTAIKTIPTPTKAKIAINRTHGRVSASNVVTVSDTGPPLEIVAFGPSSEACGA